MRPSYVSDHFMSDLVDRQSAQMSDLEFVREYIRLSTREDELEADLKRTRDIKRDIEPRLIDMFIANGMQSTNQDGHIAYLSTTLRPQVIDKAGLHDALAAAGMGDLVQPNVNSNSLGARLREWVDNNTDYSNIGPAPMPEALVGVVELHPVTNVRVKRA